MSIELLRELATPAQTKLVLLVLDGLGGLPGQVSKRTELETARTPNFDRLAINSSCGLLTPVSPGVTPGSGPGHLALFGFDPVKNLVGRGVLSALGVGLHITPKDVACRVNFASMENGLITDRRAGRIPTEVGVRLCEKLRGIRIPGVEITVQPEMQYRAVVVFRGEGLSAALSDTDPQQVGLAPLPIRAADDRPESARTAELFNQFIAEANRVLADDHPANTILLRGFDKLPDLPTFEEAYGLKSAVVAVYPMYKGLARLVGMDVLTTGQTFAEQVATVAEAWDQYDFFFIHVKPTDSAGEDGDFARKERVIEEVDRYIPDLMRLNPDVLAVTGDHSTPARMRSHSWHPVPLLLNSQWARQDDWLTGFGERECARGSLGHLRSQDLLALMLAHGERLKKFGA